MEKVSITQKQADIITKALNFRKGNKDTLLKDHASISFHEFDEWVDEYEVLNSIDLPTLAQVLYTDNYEIKELKPEFKAGDKVVTTWEGGNIFYTLLKFHSGITNPIEGRGWYLVNQPFGIHEKHIRHATPEEIYWLETLGRKKVNDFQKGDAVLDADGSLNRLTTQYHIDQAISWYRDRPEELIGIYPDESFKPFSGGDEE